MTLENWLAVIGGGSVIFMLYRINLVLAQDFPDDDFLVKDPLAHAVTGSANFDKFKDSSWKGFDALWAAIRFRTFYRRFTPLISPRDAKICALGMLGLFIGVIVVAQIAKAEPKVNGIIGATTAAMNVFWWAIIEHGRFLKKSVEKLRVT